MEDKLEIKLKISEYELLFIPKILEDIDEDIKYYQHDVMDEITFMHPPEVVKRHYFCKEMIEKLTINKNILEKTLKKINKKYGRMVYMFESNTENMSKENDSNN